ncbi:MAG TPA: mechanosensitive ion channel domain-containing protein [Clostridia bacterium]|nr:mechanosensitive ion channel domain-containing protein [Clostridia bacterium]
MFDFFSSLLVSLLGERVTEVITYIILMITILLVCLIVRCIAEKIVIKFIERAIKRSQTKWDDILLHNKVFNRASNLLIPITMHLFSGSFPNPIPLWNKVIYVLTLLFTMLIIGAVLNAVDEIYREYEISKIRPIKGLLQVIKVVVFIIGGIVLIAVLVGESPMVLLGGIGAMTAVTSFIFKDAILGFVAGIQLSANDMVRIGDWIEMPQHSADGTVIDLSLTTVKVENFDKTITTVPAYSLVSDAFINWRGMQDTGGRRIMRSINIDANGVKLCDDEMIERFKKIFLIKDYISNKTKEIEKHNKINEFDLSVQVNGRRMTNLGVFRVYIGEYIKNNKNIRKDMTMMIRQLSATENGIPLQVYAFTNTVVWDEYEVIQADIFDHLYSVAPEFGLSVFQNPSGNDIRKAIENDN